MIVLAGCNDAIKILGATLWSDGPTNQHLILRRQALISGCRIGFLSPYTIKIPTTFSKNYRSNVVQASSLVSVEEENEKDGLKISRRVAVMLGFPMLAGMVGLSDKALAVKQLQLAGRVPGISPPDENGMRTYHRPEAKSGGHGVGWSPIIPYAFTVPPDWEEVPVSIADLGGTEIDLRFANKKEGNASVVVAPVLRFADAHIMFSELSTSFASNFGLFNMKTLLSNGAVLMKIVFLDDLRRGNNKAMWTACRLDICW